LSLALKPAFFTSTELLPTWASLYTTTWTHRGVKKMMFN
jgi:hypothetical protein